MSNLNIFNSLGSNYSLQFVLKSLLPLSSKSSVLLTKYLEKKYGGDVYLFYKGRQALEMALSKIETNKQSKVLINGFTCYVVYQASVNAKKVPVYLDIDKNDLNYSVSTLKKYLEKSSSVCAVVVQNTLGFPADIENICKVCRDAKIPLIEDLAHSIGAKYINGKPAGSYGDMVVLSFSQDKVIDAVSGGALIIRNKKYLKNMDIKFSSVEWRLKAKDYFYPILTFLIRSSYRVYIGKIIHSFAKSLGLLSSPVSKSKEAGFQKLPAWHANLILQQLKDLKQINNHRKSIAKIYLKEISKQVQLADLMKKINYAANIRYPILVNNRKSLIEYLKKHGVYVSDIWYDAPISPKKYLSSTNYLVGTCPNSEIISKYILNLPTHVNVAPKKAKQISELVNKWLNTK